MKLLIKILGQTQQYPALHVDFGAGYTFPWNEAQKAYCYAPKSQKEVDEIFASQSIHGVWFFAPVLIEGEATATAPTAPEAKPAAAPEAEAEVERLTGLLRAAEAIIAKKSAAAKEDAETIATLRAELKAQQQKAGAPAKGKPGRKPKAKDEPAPTDSPAPELAPE